ncbi:hypothetical protein B566_EDAN008713 [Ephemera danica]|nr:hypothetical protein B566_EDAN008713 [Ephemera danica]
MKTLNKLVLLLLPLIVNFRSTKAVSVVHQFQPISSQELRVILDGDYFEESVGGTRAVNQVRLEKLYDVIAFILRNVLNTTFYCDKGCQQLEDNDLALADEIINPTADAATTSATPYSHTNQYIIDDLNKPTTSAPQSYLRSLCQERRGVFPHPRDCRKFVDCWDGRVREKYCPDNQVFSDLPGGFCDYLEYVDCGSRPLLKPLNPTTTTSSTTSKPSTMAPVPSNWPLVRRMRYQNRIH